MKIWPFNKIFRPSKKDLSETQKIDLDEQLAATILYPEMSKCCKNSEIDKEDHVCGCSNSD